MRSIFRAALAFLGVRVQGQVGLDGQSVVGVPDASIAAPDSVLGAASAAVGSDKVADMIARSKQLGSGAKAGDPHSLVNKLQDAISRARLARSSDLSYEQMEQVVSDTNEELQRLEEQDKLNKVQDALARARVAHSSAPAVDPADEASSMLGALRQAGAAQASPELKQNLALGAQIEGLNANIAKLKDVEARAAALEAHASEAQRSEEAVQETDDALAALKTALQQAQNLEQEQKLMTSGEPAEKPEFGPSAVEAEEAQLLGGETAEVLGDLAAEQEEEKQVTSGDNPADLMTNISPHDTAEQGTLETAIQVIRSAATDPRDATEKLIELMRAEGDKLESLGDKVKALAQAKDEFVAQSVRILRDAENSSGRANAEADVANELNAEAGARLEQLAQGAQTGVPGLGASAAGRGTKAVMAQAEKASQRAQLESRSAQELAASAEHLSARATEMADSVEEQTQMMEEFLGNIKMISQNALDEAHRTATAEGWVGRVEEQRDGILAEAATYESMIKDMQADVPRELSLGDRLQVFADQTVKNMAGLRKEAGCEEGHQAAHEKEFAAVTGESAKHIPHECTEETCEEEDPCESNCPDSTPAPALPPVHEVDPCDQALKDAKSRLVDNWSEKDLTSGTYQLPNYLRLKNVWKEWAADKAGSAGARLADLRYLIGIGLTSVDSELGMAILDRVIDYNLRMTAEPRSPELDLTTQEMIDLLKYALDILLPTESYYENFLSLWAIQNKLVASLRTGENGLSEKVRIDKGASEKNILRSMYSSWRRIRGLEVELACMTVERYYYITIACYEVCVGRRWHRPFPEDLIAKCSYLIEDFVQRNGLRCAYLPLLLSEQDTPEGENELVGKKPMIRDRDIVNIVAANEILSSLEIRALISELQALRIAAVIDRDSVHLDSLGYYFKADPASAIHQAFDTLDFMSWQTSDPDSEKSIKWALVRYCELLSIRCSPTQVEDLWNFLIQNPNGSVEEFEFVDLRRLNEVVRSLICALQDYEEALQILLEQLFFQDEVFCRALVLRGIYWPALISAVDHLKSLDGKGYRGSRFCNRLRDLAAYYSECERLHPKMYSHPLLYKLLPEQPEMFPGHMIVCEKLLEMGLNLNSDIIENTLPRNPMFIGPSHGDIDEAVARGLERAICLALDEIGNYSFPGVPDDFCSESNLPMFLRPTIEKISTANGVVCMVIPNDRHPVPSSINEYMKTSAMSTKLEQRCVEKIQQLLKQGSTARLEVIFLLTVFSGLRRQVKERYFCAITAQAMCANSPDWYSTLNGLLIIANGTGGLVEGLGDAAVLERRENGTLEKNVVDSFAHRAYRHGEGMEEVYAVFDYWSQVASDVWGPECRLWSHLLYDLRYNSDLGPNGIQSSPWYDEALQYLCKRPCEKFPIAEQIVLHYVDLKDRLVVNALIRGLESHISARLTRQVETFLRIDGTDQVGADTISSDEEEERSDAFASPPECSTSSAPLLAFTAELRNTALGKQPEALAAKRSTESSQESFQSAEYVTPPALGTKSRGRANAGRRN
ncbi:hypothetical protein GNI_081350 [Gregarina niphandrodes]|uniref:Uncharacterized protein n=1 Tax=Gregarina niphandrodes TaxID=110365 RepID=A0A023B696_GRENI|nr:hypothetical protein GNI_081350 [Gregarina niphandrodes]EZG65925.1 hypothetical protein GNI_081350 [Gregarina niphandrodes]|eukprot:XP_011134019.1 hypothetical protein GNI_081350 [Gregarina niphandrodes]